MGESVRHFCGGVSHLFSCLLKILNYDGLWENKKSSHENQRFDRIKLIY